MTPDDRARLIHLLGMLGSSHDGEVLNAAKLAQRHLGTMGLTWADALGGGGGGYTEANVEAAYQAGHASGWTKGYAEAKADAVMNGGRTGMSYVSWRAVAQDLLDCHDSLLTDWEKGFFESYVEKRWGTPTERQRMIFERVADKTGVSLPP